MQEEIFESGGEGDHSPSPSVSRVAGTALNSFTEDVLTDSLPVQESFALFQGATSSLPLPTGKSRRLVQMESPEERFLRLRMELNELSADLNEISSVTSAGQQSLWALLQSETHKMTGNLENLLTSHSKTLQFSKPSSDDIVPIEILKQLQSQLSAPVMDSVIAHAPVTSSDSRLIELDQRIFQLEQMIGMGSNTVPLSKSLQSSESKLALLDVSSTEELKHRLTTFKHEIDSMISANGSGTGAASTKSHGADSIWKAVEAVKSLNDVTASVHNIESVMGDLPMLFNRLKTLERVHWNATTFANRLQEMEHDVNSVMQLVLSNQDALEGIKAGLQDNLNTMQQNIALMEARLSRDKL